MSHQVVTVLPMDYFRVYLAERFIPAKIASLQ